MRGFKFPPHSNARQRRSVRRQIARGEAPILPEAHPAGTKPFCTSCGRKPPPTPVSQKRKCVCGSLQFIWLTCKESNVEHARRVSQMVGDYYRNRSQARTIQ